MKLTESVPVTLHSMADPEYRAFQCRLMPTVDPARVIGVRTPALRQLAKTMFRSGEGMQWLKEAPLPHRYYEEDNLHAFLTEQIRDYDVCVAELNRFLPYVDNWATCDLMTPKVLGKYPERLTGDIRRWLSSGAEYTVRFGIEMLMHWFLDERYTEEYPAMVAEAVRDEERYYVRMMAAWYFATALAKQYEAVLPWITENRLPAWVHGKSIQKALESNRISAEQKAFLRTLRQRE